MNTLLLDRTAWDLVLDAAGNIALASKPYAVAQDVASAIKLFRGELFYNTLPGVPYWEEFLGHQPPLALVREHVRRAAMTVPEVASAICTLTSYTDRALAGYVAITLQDGTTQTVSF
ncbi:hypothetical protein AXYL_04629 [Achromobacter xylosoxidans A8]|uniref:Uncharacterized protein n=1 Tax=Achromobacter xylosoxidans (strain A8) TaxID=762376 RepID=E3HI85_ACHXA|nr:hypothetical protein [Achromobacter xylosoxidans]ADP17944.1 hypothetical protein AXYL_04629 [Achromobacter xylosoxidans A8]